MDGSAVASAVRVAGNSDSWLSRLRGLSPVITRLADGGLLPASKVAVTSVTSRTWPRSMIARTTAWGLV
jgi:hypothetical protein